MSRRAVTSLYRCLLLAGILSLWQFASGRLVSAFFISIPNASALLAALQQGRIDGFAASSPLSDQAVDEQDAVKLFRMSAGAIHDPATIDAVRDTFHAAHHAKFDKAQFDEIWAATLQAWPKTVAVTPDNARKVIAFLNEFGSADFTQDLVQTGFDYSIAAKARGCDGSPP